MYIHRLLHAISSIRVLIKNDKNSQVYSIPRRPFATYAESRKAVYNKTVIFLIVFQLKNSSTFSIVSHTVQHELHHHTVTITLPRLTTSPAAPNTSPR